MMSLQSALVGFGLLKTLPAALPKLLPMSKPFTPQENVILQTVAVATGTMPLAAGLVGIIPALEMMTVKEDGRGPIILGFWSLVLWCLAGEYFALTQILRYCIMVLADEQWHSLGKLTCLHVILLGWLIIRVFLAAPLRRQVIVKEKLVFPSGSEYLLSQN